MKGAPKSERALILAPQGRDAEVAFKLLREAGWTACICADIAQLMVELDGGAAIAIITEEALAIGDIERLASWIRAQPPWSDFPIALLTGRGDTPHRNSVAQRLQDTLGNVSFLERPFHPTTLVSVAHSGLRSRRRQYQARDLLQRYELLARELQHRTKNLLSVIHSIGSASLRQGGGGREEFLGRLRALGKAQDLIVGGEERGVPMADLVATALESFGERVSIDGPHVLVNPSAAQGFALVLHELATNASKHGALTVDNGRVSVRWTLSDPPADPTLIFQWEERGGPPVVAPPQTGFGHILLQHAVANAEGLPVFDYSPDGFSYELRAALVVMRH